MSWPKWKQDLLLGLCVSLVTGLLAGLIVTAANSLITDVQILRAVNITQDAEIDKVRDLTIRIDQELEAHMEMHERGGD